MTRSQLHYLNIGLMLISTVAAFAIPFKLFLFSYAVLGPLHYLTEISWLKKRQFFSTGKYDWLFLTLLSIASFITGYYLNEYSQLTYSFIAWAFLGALIMILIKNHYLKLAALAILLIPALLFRDSRFFFVFFGVFLPTIIHVFLFTGAFILYGALKERSFAGIASLVVFLLCSLSFFLITDGPNDANPIVFRHYGQFAWLNAELLNLFNLAEIHNWDEAFVQAVFQSDAGKMVMRFIAFSYTYHYLNWFSKTKVIRWHEAGKNWLIVSVLIWIASIIIYMIDYATGIKWLFVLSMMHVFLEFPLNFRTFIGIGKELKTITGNLIPAWTK